MTEISPILHLEIPNTKTSFEANAKTSFEANAKMPFGKWDYTEKHVLCILGGWPMDRDENASRATNLEFVGIFLKWPFRHNRGPGQKPKTRIMHFENSR